VNKKFVEVQRMLSFSNKPSKIKGDNDT